MKQKSQWNLALNKPVIFRNKLKEKIEIEFERFMEFKFQQYFQPIGLISLDLYLSISAS